MSKRRELATRAQQPPSIPAALADLATRNRMLEGVPNLRTLLIMIDGLGAPIQPGIAGEAAIHFDCEILAWRLLADQVGDLVVDVWKTDFASYPPTIADTITAADQPTLTTEDHAEDTTLTGWTTTIAAGDTFRINVDSATVITRALLTLWLQSF
jgi:hypothetical protein